MGGRTLDEPVVGIAATPDGKGYWEVAADRGCVCSATPPTTDPWAAKTLDQPVVGQAPTPDGKGYWEVAADGGVFSFGSATYEGSMGAKPWRRRWWAWRLRRRRRDRGGTGP